MNTAHSIRRHRLSRGWTQADLAELTGVSAMAISHWELAKRTPRPRYVRRLEAVLGVELEQH